MPSAARYRATAQQAAERSRRSSQLGRDIAEGFPAANTINSRRRKRCEKDLQAFLETYFPSTFFLAWSPDHLRVIRRLERVICSGGLRAIAMPRGSGKGSLVERSAIWAILTGRRRFVCLVGATDAAACKLLEHLQTELRFNALLAQDYPAAIYPLICLEGNARRCGGQLYKGQPTLSAWSADRLTMPTIARKDATCCGACISVCGLTGNIRGQSHTLPSGEVIRPDLVICDDPQTRESAASPAQTQRRLEILMGDVLGLAGPRNTLACVVPCTVIYQDDLADKILDHVQHPQWQGERTKLIYAMPTDEKLWDQYRLLRDESFRRGGNGEEATEFYRLHRDAMDAGAEPAWSDRFNADELSAVQNCMNLLLRDAAAFYAEYQNDPQHAAGQEKELPGPDAICSRVNGYGRYEIPPGCQWITAYIDVQKTLLYYCVVAWEQGFTGYVVDYGAWPDQRRSYFTLGEARYTLQTLLPTAAMEAQIYHGLEQLVEHLSTLQWSDAGTLRHVDRIWIDANWGLSRDTVYTFCKRDPHARALMPAHGRFFGARSKPLAEYERRKGDTIGHHWRIPPIRRRGEPRHVEIDINYWKSFLVECLRLHKVERQALTLFGSEPERHKMLADHVHAEQCQEVTAAGRKVDEWRQLPNRPDNHLLDCLVGCFAAASMCGCLVEPKARLSDAPKGKDAPPAVKRKRVSYFKL